MIGEGQNRTNVLPRDNDLLFGKKKEKFYLTENDDADHLKVYYDSYFESKGNRKILLEKTPSNSMRLRWLQRWFSPSQFIIIARSPYGVCEGMNRKTGVSFERAAKNWNIIYSTILETCKQIDRSVMITYDELTYDTDRALKDIALFLRLKQSFPSFENKKFKIQEKHSEIKNMNYKSIDRLSKTDLVTINNICDNTVNRIGLKIVT